MTSSDPSRLEKWLEDAWLERYLDKKTTAEETAWFETYLFGKPELLERVDLDTTLRDGLVLHGASDEAGFAVAEDRSVADQTRPKRRRRTSSVIWRAAAASLFAIAVFAAGTRVGQRSDEPLIASPRRIVFDTWRSAQTPPQVDHGDSASPYVLVEIAVPAGATHITARLDTRTLEGLEPSPDGFVSFLVDARTATGTNVELTFDAGGKPVRRTYAIPR